MNALAELEARAAAEITQYEYPSRDWLVSDPAVPELAILGWGQVSLLLAVALRRERIDRFVVLGGPVDRAGVYAALAEPERVPRLDCAGREMSIPALGLPRWLAARGQAPGALFGRDLAAMWLEYLEWLARQAGVEACGDAVSLRTAGDTVVVGTGAEHEQRARRVVLTWSGSSGSRSCLAADLDEAVAGHRVAVHGDDAAACDLASTSLAFGARSVTIVVPKREQASPALLERDTVVHGWPLLDARHRAALRDEARRIPVPPPAAWLARLRADQRVSWTDGEAEADIVLVAGDPLPTLTPASGLCVGEDLSHAAMPLLSVLAPDPAGPNAPLLHPLNLVRFGIPRLVAAISREIFLRDADALFQSFLGFETAEGLGGRLLSDT